MTKRSSRSLSRSSSRPSSSQGHESFTVPSYRDSPSLPQAPLRVSQTFSSITVLVSDATVSTTSHTAVSLSPSPCPSNDHLRHASHSSTSTAIESTPQTPADFRSEQSADQAIAIVDSPMVDIAVLREPKLSLEVDNSAPLYADDILDDDQSYPGPELSARISPTASDDMPAFGLNLLQDFVNGNVDDGASVRSLSESASTTIDEPRSLPNVSQPPAGSPRSSVYSLGSAQRESFITRDVPSRTSTDPSYQSSDYGGEEWDGALDIYDNYRYSRASMASKMSRTSKSSTYTVASGLGLDAPPLPISESHRPSLDSVKYGFVSMQDRLGPITTASASIEDVRRTVQKAESPITEHANPADNRVSIRRVPSPLDLSASVYPRPYSSSEIQAIPSSSPLLHSAFYSPLSSPGAQSSSCLSPTSSSSATPLAPGGAATTLRQRLEIGKVSEPSSTNVPCSVLSEINALGKVHLSSQLNVMEDEEGAPGTSMVAFSQPSSSSTSFSATEEKKRMIGTTYAITAQAPPPPYTLISSSEEASLDCPQNVEKHTRGTEASSSHTASAFIRRSLFLPHPHAPKPLGTPHGPMYGREPVDRTWSASSTSLSGSATHTLHMALSLRGDPFHPRPVSIFARFERELTTSAHPVLVTFSLEPQNNIPVHRTKLPVATANYESNTPATSQSPTQSISHPSFPPQAPGARRRSRSFSDLDVSFSEKDTSNELVYV
jgi:TBC1 domain family member 10